MKPNPNVTILSGETAAPLGRQTRAFAFPADINRCDTCSLPGARVTVADRSGRIASHCRAHGLQAPRGWDKV